MMTTNLSDVEELNRVLDALSESVLETSDKDIYQETIDAGDNPEEIAKSTRALLLKAASAPNRGGPRRIAAGEIQNVQVPREFWESLFRPLVSVLYNRIRATVHLSEDDVEDCAHEVLFRLHRNFDFSRLGGMPDSKRKSAFYAFVSHTTRVVLAERIRQTQKVCSNAVALDDWPCRTPRLRASVVEALARLAPDEQLLVREHLIHNKSYLEIQREFCNRGTEVSRSALVQQLSHAVKKLRSTVELESNSAESRCSADGDNQAVKGFFLGHDGAGRPIRCYEGGPHIMTFGAPGSGKTSGLLIPALLTFQGSCVVIDLKGELASVTKSQRERLGQRVLIVDPFEVLPENLGRVAKFNPLAHLDPEASSFQADCDSLAQGLIVNDGDRDEYWSDAARQLLSGIIMHVVVTGGEEEKTLNAVRKLVCAPPGELRTVVRSALKSDRSGYVSSRLRQFATVDGDNRVLAGIVATAITQTNFLESKPIAESMSCSDFSFRDLKETPTTVYIVLPQSHLYAYSKWLRLLVGTALATLLEEEQGPIPVLVMLDECAQVGRLKEVESAMTLGAGSGVQIWAILQDLTQLKQLYGECWRTLLANSGVQQFFPADDAATKEYISTRCGEAFSCSARLLWPEIRDECYTGGERVTASSASASDAGRCFISFQEALPFKSEHFYLFAEGIDYPIEGQSTPYWEIEELSGLYSSERTM